MEKTIIGILTKNGHKARAQKIFYRVVSNLSKRHRVSPQKLLAKVTLQLEPVLDYFPMKRGSTKYIYPSRISAWKVHALMGKWIVQSAKLRSERDIVSRLEGEFNDVLSGKGRALTRKLEFHKRAVSNRSALRNIHAWRLQNYNFVKIEQSNDKIINLEKFLEKLFFWLFLQILFFNCCFVV